MAFRTRALPTIGQEVIGLDLDGEPDDATAAALRDLWRDAGLVLFRDVGAAPARLRALSRIFGELEPHPIADFRLTDHPDMILLTNRGRLRGPVYAFDGVPTYGRIPWHTDLAFSTRPNAGALLNMVEKASIGGQTAWLDTQAACAAMDPALLRRLEGVEAAFAFCADLGGVRFDNPGGVRVGEATAAFPDYPPIARPILWRHPHTGHAILNICPLNLRGIVGMAAEEGDALIEALLAAVLDPRFVHAHDWAEGDVMLWDNYRMMHRAEGHPVDVPRVVHRTTLRGDAIVGRAMPA
ncbi:MAG: TauD/TfdA family dioxygenase [Sphingomonas sp.]